MELITEEKDILNSNHIKEVDTGRSVNIYTPVNRDLYYSPHLEKLKRTIPIKIRNTYIGFPLSENTRIRDKRNQSNTRSVINQKIIKHKRAFSRRKMMKGLAKISKNLVVDLKYYEKKPIKTSDVWINGKMFSNALKSKAINLLSNY